MFQNSKQGLKYGREKSYDQIMKFVLDRIDADIREISRSVWNALIKGKNSNEKPTLVFVCGENRYCFTNEERLRVAATFVSFVIITRLVMYFLSN